MKFSVLFHLALLQAPGSLAHAVPASEGELFVDGCWWGKDVGCSADGWCWKTCNRDEGTWCWTAANKGSCTGCGDWYACSRDSDCNRSMACGADDPSTPQVCEDCGCACWE